MIHYIRQETEWLFPVPLWKFSLPNCNNINKKIEKRIYQKSKEEKTRSASNEGGWHSLGNMYDRLYYFAVPDFIDFHLGDFHWFIFNVADIFITMGIIGLIIFELLGSNFDEQKN